MEKIPKSEFRRMTEEELGRARKNPSGEESGASESSEAGASGAKKQERREGEGEEKPFLTPEEYKRVVAEIRWRRFGEKELSKEEKEFMVKVGGFLLREEIDAAAELLGLSTEKLEKTIDKVRLSIEFAEEGPEEVDRERIEGLYLEEEEHVVTEADIEKEFDYSWQVSGEEAEKRVSQAIIRQLQIEPSLKGSIGEALGEEIKDRQKELDNVQVAFLKDWFDEHRYDKRLRELGIDPDLDIADEKKATLAEQAGAFDELRQKREFKDRLEERNEALRNLNNAIGLKDYLGGRKTIAMDAQFATIDALNTRIDRIEEKLKEAKDKKERDQLAQEKSDLIELNRKLIEGITGRDLVEEAKKEAAEGLGDWKDDIRKAAQERIKEELGSREEYTDEKRIRNSKLIEEDMFGKINALSEKKWEDFAKERGHALDDDKAKIEFAKEQVAQITSAFAKIFERREPGVVVLEETTLQLVKDGHKPSDFKSGRGVWHGFVVENKETGEKFKTEKKRKQFLNDLAEKYREDVKEEKEKLAEEWDKEYDALVMDEGGRTAQWMIEDNLKMKFEDIARSPERAGKTMEDIHERIKGILWAEEAEDVLAETEKGKRKLEDFEEFAEEKGVDAGEIIDGIFNRKGPFAEVPAKYDANTREWLVDRLEGEGITFEDEEKAMAVINRSVSRDKWEGAVRSRMGFLELMIKIIVDAYKKAKEKEEPPPQEKGGGGKSPKKRKPRGKPKG